MKLRWVLPPLAALSVGGIAWIASHGKEVTPQALLELARARSAARPSDTRGALRALEEALSTARGEELRELRGECLRERSLLYWNQGLPELALADCRARMAELGPDAETLARATELCLWIGDSGAALELAARLQALDPARARSLAGRCRVSLADVPLAQVEELARAALPLAEAENVVTLAQRATVFAADESISSAALEELLEAFSKPEDRRAVAERVREAAEHLELARAAFVESLEPGFTGDAVAGLQDLLLRGGADLEAVELGLVALAIPNLQNSMPVLARTASALVDLGRLETARALILDLEKRKPGALRPQSLPSNDLRDELEQWCLLLEELQLWEELADGAGELAARARGKSARGELARFLSGLADLRLGRLGPARSHFEGLGARRRGQGDLPVRAWLGLAEIANRQKQRPQERYALLFATKAAALDPEPPLRAELGRAWQRLHEIQLEEGSLSLAATSLTHALRCSPERREELEPLWNELGRRALATRGARSPYQLYSRAKNQADRNQDGNALADAQTLLKSYPGLGPALEIVSRTAFRLRNYPVAIQASLELLERGWPGEAASARLRKVPDQFFLRKDRVRWMQLDPRGSLEAVVRRLLDRGDVDAAALAARAGPAKWQPPELLPLLARVEFEAGYLQVAHETLALLPADGAPFRSCTGLALRLALAREEAAGPEGTASDLSRALEKVRASGRAEDPELVAALDALFAAGHVSQASALLSWLSPQSPPFLAEVLLRSAVGHALAGEARIVDDDLERAASLLADGRADLGRLVLAAGRDDWNEVAREAGLARSTPLASSAGRRLALACLAGDLPAAAAELARVELDGRDLLLDLSAACLHALDPALPAGAAPGLPELSPFLLDALPPARLLVLALAADVAPWSAWTLARTGALAPALQQDPWIQVLRARSLVALGQARAARAALDPLTGAETSPAAAWWLRATVERALGSAEGVLAAELGWFARTRGTGLGAADLARLEAEAHVAAGERDEAVRILEAALEDGGQDPALLARLAALERVPGRRARAIELYGRLCSSLPEEAGRAHVLPFLDLLREARDAREISEARWWTEVEALEAERPLDPAPARELAARSFESPLEDPELGRAHALERLERFRARSLGRPLEELRAGEVRRWALLLARFTPQRAVAFVERELELDPGDPAAWRASAEALLAADRWKEAIERLEALQRVAPERDTARLLALTSFQIENDPLQFQKRLAAIERLDEGARDDPVLRFYRAIAVLRSRGKDADEAAARALELWRARAQDGLVGARHARALAIALFESGRRDPALAVLDEARPELRGALEGDILRALAHLMRSAPATPRVLQAGPARPAGAERPADDAPQAAPQAPAQAAEPDPPPEAAREE